MVKQIKNAFHPNLDPQETLGGILTKKIALNGKKNNTMDVHNDNLARAKKATWEYKKAHSSINQ